MFICAHAYEYVLDRFLYDFVVPLQWVAYL